MATKYFALLTNIGAAKLANATALGAQVEITQMAVGDGNGVLPTPNPAQTALTHELRRAQLNMLTIDPVNTNQIIAEQVIPEDAGGWWIREIGLFDKDGDMIAVANCAETYKPQLQEGSGRVQVIRVILIVSSTEAVTLKIDPSVVLATRKYVDDAVIEVKAYADDVMKKHVAAANPHKQYPLIANALKEMVDAGLVNQILENLRLVDESGYAGRVAKISAFTTSGVFTKSEGAKFALVRAVGGGGGGGGTAGVSNQQAVGAAGESGGYIEAWIDLASVTSLPVTIGSAGAGGAAGANFGSSGGTTSLGTLVTCPGGNGGPGGSSSSGVPSLNSDYGSESTVAPSTTGKLIASIRSKRDSYRMALSLAAVIGGCGGSSPFGRGGAPGSADSGKDGQGYGSGGGGASSTGTSFKGGNGTPGIMIIQEYF
ncbi:phage tail protein [Escherichia coli]